MSTTLHVTTKVLPGHRIEITSPELLEGQAVEVTVVVPKEHSPQRLSALEIINKLPPGPHCFATWDEYERHLEMEKNSWDR